MITKADIINRASRVQDAISDLEEAVAEHQYLAEDQPLEGHLVGFLRDLEYLDKDLRQKLAWIRAQGECWVAA